MNSNNMTRTNKRLLIVLLILAVAFVLTKVFRSPARESNLDADVFKVDTASITAVRITSSGNEAMSTLLREADTGWTVEQNTRTAKVARSERDALLRTLANVSAERIVSRKEQKWDNYEVGDSTALEVVLFGNDMRELAHWYVGRQSQGATYARADGENEVYALNGSLRRALDKNFADWRDKTFLEINPAFVEKIAFSYPADSSFILEKQSDGWMVADVPADSARVEHYLGLLRSKNLTTFAQQSPTRDADVTVKIEGNAITPVTVKGWRSEGNRWVLSSSMQDSVYFYDSAFVDDLFVGKEAMLQ